ncbi:hypothetical protein XPA_008040 [Xanthoria parietina]
MYGESSVVFLAPRQADHGAVRTAETPRRYIVGKSEDGDDSPAGSTIADENVSTGGCVMAVLMLNTIEPGLVPGMERRAYLPMEISSVEELWFSANEIIRSCMRYGLGFGWREEGLDFNMGVFLWAKDSAIDRHFAQEMAMVAGAGTTPDVKTS